MKILHSCCPGKVDIHAPEFELISNLGRILEYHCKGCKTVIFVAKETE